MSLIHGLLLGLGTAFIIGPVFFTLLRNSLQLGIKAGISTASGIFISDIAVLAICYYLTAHSLEKWLEHPLAVWISVAVLLSFGFQFLFKKIVEFDENQKIRSADLWSAFSQGFLINFANPVVFVIWLGFLSIGQAKYSDSLLPYCIGILAAIFITDLLKASFAYRIKRWVKQHYLHKIYRLIGLALIGFGLRLLILELF